MTRAESAKLVAVVIGSYPGQAAKLDAARTDAMVNAFASMLGDLPLAEVTAALGVLIQTRTWMPSVADIRASVLEMRQGSRRTGGDAWGGLLRAIQHEGAWKTPGVDFVLHDPVTAQCVNALGWKNLCLSENQVADRARFIEMYDQLATTKARTDQSPALAAAEKRREIGTGGAAVSMVARALTGGGR